MGAKMFGKQSEPSAVESLFLHIYARMKKSVINDLPVYEGERPDWWTATDEAELEDLRRAPVSHGSDRTTSESAQGRGAWKCKLCSYWLSRDGRSGGCFLFGPETEPLPTRDGDGCQHWLPHPPRKG